MPEPSSNGHRPDDKRLSTSLRRVVADDLAEQRRLARAESGDRLDGLDERQMARAVLNRELDLRAREALRLGEQPLADAERAELHASATGSAGSRRSQRGRRPSTC